MERFAEKIRIKSLGQYINTMKKLLLLFLLFGIHSAYASGFIYTRMYSKDNKYYAMVKYDKSGIKICNTNGDIPVATVFLTESDKPIAYMGINNGTIQTTCVKDEYARQDGNYLHFVLENAVYDTDKKNIVATIPNADVYLDYWYAYYKPSDL